MAQPFPFPLVALLDNRRVMLADFGVKEHAGAYVELFEHVHNAKNTDARAVIAQRVTRHVRRVIAAGAANRHVEVEKLDIRRDPESDPRVVRPGDFLSSNDGNIVVSAILHRLSSSPAGGAPRISLSGVQS